VGVRVGLETSGHEGVRRQKGLFEHCRMHSAATFSRTLCRRLHPAHATHKPFADLRNSYGKTSVNFELTYKKLLRSTSAVITLSQILNFSALLPD
jgi:hypothetical protein